MNKISPVITLVAICLILGFFGDVFGEANYSITAHPRFSNQPIVCVYEPDEPNARDIIKELWVKETELGIKFWEYELGTTEYRQTDKWKIDVLNIPLEDSPFFDNKDCDVEVRFDPTGSATSSGSVYAGVHWFDGVRSQIRLVYTDLEVCRTWTEGNYRYTEWCYKDDYVRTKALGNIATHEFGHAIGLGHYTSDDPEENRQWSSDPYGSPSVMTESVHYNEELNKIRKIDLDKVKELYDYQGFGKPKQTTPQNIPVFEEKNLGGFESFFTSQIEYVKKKGSVDFVTISGKVTEDVFSIGQNVLIKIVFPDGHDAELKALATINRQFSIQIRVDDTIQIGKYTLEAKYMNYDSEKLSFSVLDGTSNKIEPKAEIVIPNWIRNNAKWWADGTIADRDFVMGIQFLAQQKIIKVGQTTESSVEVSQDMPQWIRNNAKWWADGMITDADFVKGIQFLAQQGIINVN